MRSEKKKGGKFKRTMGRGGSGSLATCAKIKPVNKCGGSCSVPNDSDLRLFVFSLHFILHDGTTYKIQVE